MAKDILFLPNRNLNSIGSQPKSPEIFHSNSFLPATTVIKAKSVGLLQMLEFIYFGCCLR